MITAQLNFRDGKKKALILPTGFDELTDEQFVRCIELIKAAEIDPAIQWRLLMYVSGITYQDLKILNGVQRVELLLQLAFLFDLKGLPHKSKIPPFKVATQDGQVSMAGPGDTIKHLTFGEFVMAEGRLEAWEKTGDVTMLNQLCGVLYRPQDPERQKQQDKRVPYSEGTVAYYGTLFEKVGDALKQAILLNYFGATQYLPRMYPNVFPAPKNEASEKMQVKEPRKSVSLSWLNMLFRTAEWDVTRIKSTEQTSMHTVLFGFNDMMQANKK
ncbi:hypothetical protein SAMN04487996_10434 [Dyadobacter soli]|uniref:Uncharacterized protein n=1 Tax=Dyadobacter soli TaxID=659014 RepID=A0A1G7B0F6_9BACT|nr:hypothetical protein [Dyadobacter soli]SDE20501.1 hypothetical protein SAMN04487996_10434 [Dyadobacter soli]